MEHLSLADIPMCVRCESHFADHAGVGLDGGQSGLWVRVADEGRREYFCSFGCLKEHLIGPSIGDCGVGCEIPTFRDEPGSCRWCGWNPVQRSDWIIVRRSPGAPMHFCSRRCMSSWTAGLSGGVLRAPEGPLVSWARSERGG